MLASDDVDFLRFDYMMSRALLCFLKMPGVPYSDDIPSESERGFPNSLAVKVVAAYSSIVLPARFESLTSLISEFYFVNL